MAKSTNHKHTNEQSWDWQHYGFTCDPFEKNQTEIFLPPHWQQHIALIQESVINQNVLLANIGPQGSGKTSLASYLKQDERSGFDVHYTSANRLPGKRKLIKELEKHLPWCRPVMLKPWSNWNNK